MIADIELIKSCQNRSQLCEYADMNKWRKMAPLFFLFKKYLKELGIDYWSYPLNENEQRQRLIQVRAERINQILS